MNITHVNFLIHKQDRSPATLFSPILRIRGLIYFDYFDFCPVIFDPIFPFFVHDGHKISLAVMLMSLVWPMIIMTFMKDYSYKTILASRFGVLYGLEPKLMIYVLFEENPVQKLIFDFIVF